MYPSLVLRQGIHGKYMNLAEGKGSIPVPSTPCPGIIGLGVASGTQLAVKVPGGNQPRTLAAWIKLEDPELGNRLMGYGDTADGAHHIMFFLVLRKGCWVFDGYNYDMPSNVVADSQWHMHALTYDGRMLRYFYDGRPYVEQ
jgi:hypothetical protein